MYALLDNLLSIPSQYSNSIVSYLAGTLVLLFVVFVADLVVRIIKSCIGR